MFAVEHLADIMSLVLYTNCLQDNLRRSNLLWAGITSNYYIEKCVASLNGFQHLISGQLPLREMAYSFLFHMLYMFIL